jgi:hypothetical protein
LPEAIYDMVNQWNLVEKVQAMSFDTTSANTGRFRGACVLFEKQIGRELLWLACRHNVMELILAKVFTVCFESSSCPEIRICMPFKSVWNDVIRSNYRGLELQPGTVFVESTIPCLKGVVERETQFRDDYQELIELTIILLGTPSTTIHWRARWMAKLLYAMKIFLFRDILKLTTINETRVRTVWGPSVHQSMDTGSCAHTFHQRYPIVEKIRHIRRSDRKNLNP